MGVCVSESVELATILMTDLVGSTRLATTVGPVRADQLRDEHFAVLREGVDEVAQILTAAAGHELDEKGVALAGEIATQTGGNPFFVGEVLRSLLESGRLLYDEQTGRWSVDSSSEIGLPQSVREVIEHRVERLGDETRQVLTLASVIGRSFGVELLARLVDRRSSAA